MELDSKVSVVTTPSPRRHKVPSILCTSPSGGFVAGSPKEQELSTSLSNLKWGFKRREEKLQEQLAVHKEALAELYRLHMNLKEKLNDAGTATCVHLEVAENLCALHEENEQQYVHQRNNIEALACRLIELEGEKNKLEASNQTLQFQLQELQHTLIGSTSADSSPVISEPLTKPAISSIASVVQAAYISTETFNVAEGSAIEESGVLESTCGKPKKVSALTQSPLRRNKQVVATATNRRHSLESGINKQATNDDVAAINDRRSSFPRKGATPKQDPPAINTKKSPVKQSNKAATKVAPRKKQSTTDILSATHTDGPSTTTSLSPVKDKVVTPRIPLRQRIEEHSQQLRSRDYNMNHNAWVGGFTTTNRQSGGGVQFFVDVLTPASRNRVSEIDEDFEPSGECIMESVELDSSSAALDGTCDLPVTHVHATEGDTEINTITVDSSEVEPIVLTLQPPTDTTSTTHNMNILNKRKSAHSLAEMQLLESDLNAEPEEEVSILYTPVTNVDNDGKHGVHLSVLEDVHIGAIGGISQGIAMVNSEDVDFVDDERDDSLVTPVQNSKNTNLASTPGSLFIDTSATALNVAQPVSPAPSSSNKYLLLEVQMYKRQVVELKKQLADTDVPVKGAVKKVSNVATQVTEASLFVLETSPHITSADRNAVLEVPAVSIVDTVQSKFIPPVLQIEHTPVRTLQELAAATPVAENTLPSIDLSTDLLEVTTTFDENVHEVDNMVYDDAGMFVELCDVSVQCTPDVSTVDAASNTDEVYHGTNKKEVASIVTPVGCDAITQTEMITPLPMTIVTTNQYTTTTPVVMVHTSTCTTPFPTTVDIGIAASIQNARDEVLSGAIEASKFDLGKKLFKLRMEERKIAKRNRKDPRDVQKQGSVNAGVTTVPNSSKIVIPCLPSATTVNTAAISRANEQAKLNAELITSLQEKSSRHQRDQQKIELLEQKLCRLIMYVKHTNKQNKYNNNTSNAGNSTMLTKDTQEVIESKSITPTVEVPQVPIKPTPRAPPQSNRPTRKSVKVGEMSFHGDLSHLLCIDNNDSGTSSDEDIEPTMETSNNISDVTDLFSPPRDFEGKYYDEVSEFNVTTRSNPLLHQTTTRPEYTTNRTNNVNAKNVHNEDGLDYEDVYQDNSIGDISFGHNTNAFDVPQMASLGNNKADLLSPIQRKTMSRVNSLSMPGRDAANVRSGAVQIELIESENKVNKLQQQVEYLEMRNKTLLRDKELLVGKLKRTFETDTQSFGLKIFSSEHNETYSLENPTVTASIVMGFIDNNNKLLDKIGILTANLEEKMFQQEKQAQLRAEADVELTQALAQNRHLSAEVRSLQTVVQKATHDRDELQRQVSQLTGTLVHMAQENKVLKDKMRMHSF